MVDTMATRLRQLMKGARLSYEKFGLIAEVSPQAVQKWMNGGEVKEACIRKLADYFRVSPAFIRYGVEAPEGDLSKLREGNAKYAAELEPGAIELARLWMTLSKDRQEYLRDMVFLTAYTETRYPFLRRGIPTSPNYARFEVECEEDFERRARQRNLNL